MKKRNEIIPALVFVLSLLAAATVLYAGGTSPTSLTRACVRKGGPADVSSLSTPSLTSDSSGTTLTQNLRTNGNYISGDGDDEGVYVDPSGNVGIGTTTPGQRLEVKATSGEDGYLRITGNDGTTPRSWDIKSDRASRKFSIIDVNLANTPRFVIDNNGYVGIGEDSPSYRIHVKDSSVVSLFERSTTYTNNLLTGIGLKHSTTGDMVDGFGAAFNFAIEDDASGHQWIAQVGAMRDGADNSGALVFRTTNAGTSYERMRITKNGYVGIGTTSPNNPLEVVADAAGSGIRVSGSGTYSPGLRLWNSDSSIFAQNLLAMSSGHGVSTSTAGDYVISTNTGKGILFGTSSTAGGTRTEKVKITSDGNVILSTSGASIFWGSSSGPGLHGTTTDVYAFNSSGTDTKLTAHDKDNRLIKYSYNVWTGEGTVIEIERFFNDVQTGVMEGKTVAQIVKEKGPYIHTAWNEITEITGLPRPPKRDWFKEQRDRQRDEYRRQWIAEHTFEGDENPTEAPTDEEIAQAVSKFTPDETRVRAGFQKLPKWLRDKIAKQE